MRIALWLVSGLLLFAAASETLGRPDAPKEVNPDEQKLLAAGLSADGPALVEFFRQRARLDADSEALTAASRRLGDADPAVRARAWRVLVGHGSAALPALRRAVNDLGDPEITARATHCIQIIEGEGTAVLPAAAARLLVLRKPAESVEALLAYLPAVEKPGVVEDVASALSALAYPDDKPHPALLAALDDAAPLRRAVAGSALCRKDRPGARTVVHKLLRDPRPLVRLRIALALAEADDVEAFPVLIDLLAELAAPQCKEAEELLQRLAGEWAPNPAVQGDDEIARRIRRDAWAGWWRNTEGPTLLAEFRRRTLSPGDQDKVTALIEKLGDDSFDVRQRAAADLTVFGVLAAPLLREATRGADLERTRLAEDCLHEIAEKGGKPLPAAAARLLTLRKPPGAIEALLDFLPFAGDEHMIAEVQTALSILALRDGKVDPALTRALEDKQPLRRAIAAEALLRTGVLDQRPAVSKLLRDADPQVRLRTALGLATRADKEAVPVLIDSLAEEPSAASGEAEELLYRLAGEQTPKLEPVTNTASRRKQRDSWAAWWKEKASTIDMSVLDNQERLLGYTLLVEGASPNGRVMELGRDGKPRWVIPNLPFPCDAYIVGGNRVLIAECHGNRVTERDFKGNILWQKGLTSHAVNAQRLANGNTFIASGNEMQEVDRAGKTLWTVPYPVGVSAAYKGRDGVITCLTQGGQCVRLTTAGKELKSFLSGRNGGGFTSGIDVTPNGRILISQPNQGTVVEMDAEGKMIWESKAPGIATATRLPNGHTLVANYGSSTVTELDRAGKTVWEYKENMAVFRARRR
jgi:HEAT repeat protein